MLQEDVIYNKAKDRLRKYWSIAGNSTNQKVIYECAIILYLIRQEYEEDTRFYYIPWNVYEQEKAQIYQLQNKLRKDEEGYEEAEEACNETLTYIDLIISPRVNIKKSS